MPSIVHIDRILMHKYSKFCKLCGLCIKSEYPPQQYRAESVTYYSEKLYTVNVREKDVTFVS